MANLLLASKVDVNAVDRGKKSALHHATECGDTKMVELLLDSGTAVDPASIKKETPLHLAARFCAEVTVFNFGPYVESRIADSRKVVHTLLKRGADVNARNQRQQTPLHIIAQRRCDVSR